MMYIYKKKVKKMATAYDNKTVNTNQAISNITSNTVCLPETEHRANDSCGSVIVGSFVERVVTYTSPDAVVKYFQMSFS